MIQVVIIVLLLLYIAYYYVTMSNVVTRPGMPVIMNISTDSIDQIKGMTVMQIEHDPTFFPDGYQIIVNIPK